MEANIGIVLYLVLPPLVCGLLMPYICNLCGGDTPNVRRAILISALGGVVAYLVFDLLGYGILLATREYTGLVIPPGYSYLRWLSEHPSLKWQVSGLVPVTRYMAIGMAICAGVGAYVLVLKEPFRISLAIFLLQWAVSIALLAVLSLVAERGFGLAFSPRPTDQANSWLIRPPPDVHARTRPTIFLPDNLDGPLPVPGAKPNVEAKSVPPQPPEPNRKVGPNDPAEKHAGKQSSPGILVRTQQGLDPLRRRLDPFLESLQVATEPVTRRLPSRAQTFLDQGGWWLVLIPLPLGSLLWLIHFSRRIRLIVSSLSQSRTVRPTQSTKRPGIDLAMFAEALTDQGGRQITVRALPGRLRLVVLAPTGGYVGDLLPEMAANLLDHLHAGLGDVVDDDHPRVVLFPRFVSEKAFRQFFHDQVAVPPASRQGSPWVLLAGSVAVGRQSLFVGLAVHLDQPSSLGEIAVDKHQWSTILAVRQTA